MWPLLIAVVLLGAHVDSGGAHPRHGILQVTDSMIQLRWFSSNGHRPEALLHTDTNRCVPADCGMLQWSLLGNSAESECECCRGNGVKIIHQTIKGCVKDHVIGLLSNPASFITSIRASTAQDCQSHCTKQDNCTFFSFHKPGQTAYTENCFLKKADTWTKVTFDDEKMSGFSLAKCPGTDEEVTSSAPDSSSSTTPPTSQPPFNYTLDGLVFVPERMSWVEALHHCAERGSRLLHILDNCTQVRVEELLAMVALHGGCVQKAWVGLERCMINPHAPWEWSGGAVVGHYQRWSPSFPHKPCCFHCGQLLQEGAAPGQEHRTYRWQDACCREKLPFICAPANGTQPCQT